MIKILRYCEETQDGGKARLHAFVSAICSLEITSRSGNSNTRRSPIDVERFSRETAAFLRFLLSIVKMVGCKMQELDNR